VIRIDPDTGGALETLTSPISCFDLAWAPQGSSTPPPQVGQAFAEGGDVWSLTLTAGQTVRLQSSTPFDDPTARPRNSLNPTLALYDGTGSIVAVDADSATDGRNAQLTYTSVTGGSYLVQVLPAAGVGEYLLSVDPFAQPPVRVRGDLNLDGQLSNTDIQALLDALVDLDGYKTSHSLSDADLVAVGDIDGNGSVSNTDIQALLDLLTSGGPQTSTSEGTVDLTLTVITTPADADPLADPRVAPNEATVLTKIKKIKRLTGARLR
jgi:hypothetical protein